MVDVQTRMTLSSIPPCTKNAGPRSDDWTERLKEEYLSLIAVSLLNYNKKEVNVYVIILKIKKYIFVINCC